MIGRNMTDNEGPAMQKRVRERESNCTGSAKRLLMILTEVFRYGQDDARPADR
jgi:hypothetical protein